MKKLIINTLLIVMITILTACNPLSGGSGIKTIEFIDSVDTPIETYEVAYGSKLEAPDAPTYLDYEFDGWYEDSRYTKPWNFDTHTVKKDTKLYAKWLTTITQTVSIQVGFNSSNEPVYEKQVTLSKVNVNPKVVVTFALEVVDIFQSVGFDKTGITFFGLPKSNLPASISAFESNKYPNTGTLFEPNYDTLDLMMPDLIILGGRSANLYTSLKQKYPNTDIIDVSNSTFSFGKLNEVMDTLKLVFPNISEELTNKQNLIDAKLSALQSKVNGQNALFLQVNGDQISVFGAGSRYGVIYNEFKFMPSDPGLQTLETHGNVVSFEYVSEVNPQIIFLMDRSAAIGSTGALDQIMNNALIKNTTAGKNSDIYVLDPISWYILPGGVESTLKMIEDIEQIFNK
ncbi:ABC transporter substrate-binding protein [Acholeplasma laidlawii]|uniref:ABC transporter substrate-binding protein n=1 Tax=Acholeplasma laidlawii TaxID=2148 RepID=A0A553IHE5_ACHLA|nr:ABC transporter substrate-binding protein [Acholeplasma laidlawii]TRX99618.1 ABC transporter substrate-binding protein [Acholeplasma laidlawii]